jgi:lysozyme
MASTVIIDLSHHNPEPDWAALKASGVVGVILKATESTGYIDPSFVGRRSRAKANALAVATYHYLKHGNIGLQMLHYLDVVQPKRGERVVVDYEDEHLTLDELELAVTTLMGSGLGLQVTVYGGGLLKTQLGLDRSPVLAQTSLWVAHYTPASMPSWPRGTWPHWTLWQYTDKALVSGVSERVDGNRFNGIASNALKWLNPAPAAVVDVPEPATVPVPGPVDPAPVRDPRPDELVVELSGYKPGTVLHIFVNGSVVATVTAGG